MGEPTVNPLAPAAIAAIDTGIEATLAFPTSAGGVASVQPVRHRLAATSAAQRVLEVMGVRNLKNIELAKNSLTVAACFYCPPPCVRAASFNFGPPTCAGAQTFSYIPVTINRYVYTCPAAAACWHNRCTFPKKQAIPHTAKAHTLDEALEFAQSVSNQAVAIAAKNQCGAHTGASPTAS